MDSKPRKEMFGRQAQYVVMKVETVRALNIRSNEEVIEAQKQVDDDMIRALEDMVNAAKARTLESSVALQLGAIAW